MAALKRQNVVRADLPTTGRQPDVRLARDHDAAAPSPALKQLDDLGARLDAWTTPSKPTSSEAADRWSHRRTAAFIAVTCGGFWVCAALGIARLLR